MNRPPAEFPGQFTQRFVQRVHRRRAIVRCAEHAGVGLLVASAASVLCAMLIAWRGTISNTDPIHVTATLLALGAICGAIASLRRRASMLDTAMYVDRTLRSDDLIATALSVRDDSPVSRTVASIADARVRHVDPSSIALHRFASRGWTGIGLSIAAALATSLLFTTSPATMRADSSVDANANELSFIDPRNESPSDPVARSDQRSSLNDSDDRDLANATRTAHKPASSGANANGAGRSQTSDLNERGVANATRFDQSTRNSTVVERESAVGSGAESVSAREGSGASLEGNVSRAPQRAIAPWQSSSWPADRDRATEALRNGSIPDAYRDLVREYFSIEK